MCNCNKKCCGNYLPIRSCCKPRPPPYCPEVPKLPPKKPCQKPCCKPFSNQCQKSCYKPCCNSCQKPCYKPSCNPYNKHEMHMKKALDLSKKSYELYGAPFGAIVVLNDKIIGYGLNDIKCNYSLHAEINAMVEASKYLNCKDLSSCVLYTTIEPCPMCAFMAREYKLTSIYIGLNSPYMGGYSKWNILKDKQLSSFTPYFDKAPDVYFNILYKENKEFLDKTPFNKYFGITSNKPCKQKHCCPDLTRTLPLPKNEGIEQDKQIQDIIKNIF